MQSHEYLAEREAYSARRLGQLSSRLLDITSDLELDGLTVICAGSFARGEASEHSDIDLFFAYNQAPVTARPNTNHLRLFGRLIDLNVELDFPPFSRDALFLKTLDAEAMRPHLGGPHDDESNYFTMRMLTLLESRCVFSESNYTEIVAKFVHAYCEDARKHPDDFEPWALINDIKRYWDTLLLNYVNANYRDQLKDPELAEDPEVERRVRRFKLSFSRTTTCFATIAAIASQREPHTEASLCELVNFTPRARLMRAAENMPEVADIVARLLTHYVWFLQQTSQTKESLRANFASEADRAEHSERAEEYGDLVFALLQNISDLREPARRNLIRYLVV